MTATLPFPGAVGTAARRTGFRALSRPAGLIVAGAAVLALSACGDPDLRRYGKLGFDTSSAASEATLSRPTPDDRGIISYPNYQVAVARRGDSVASIANRIGMDPATLAKFNALDTGTTLNKGEVLALPQRVAEPVAPAGAAAAPAAGVDIASLASSAIERAPTTTAPAAPASSPAPQARTAAIQPAAAEPLRHRVSRGETAFTIARAYNVSPKALAEWNGLSSDMSVREGQYLLIPPSAGKNTGALSTVTAPGEGSPTPLPPSASQPLPADDTPAASTPVDTSSAPDLGSSRSASAQSQLMMPVQGKIVHPYVKKKNDGIDISAPAGTSVKAAEGGTVAAITKDTEGVPIMVLRHPDGLLTVYANVDAIAVAKGDSVKRGQSIAKTRPGSDSYLHFEVRKGFDSVDPVPYLQ